ncbi:MAG: YbaB/EbfC family nucleoid-associated protein [Armatimonadetes bacterium]|nr:YbaB/EbfC family nucleoid-associated protein [Armatimonadota bacterium]
MNMGKMLKQMEKLRTEMARAQEELGNARVEATAGGGAVTAVANGHGELQSLTIAPAAVDPSDVGLLQDLIIAAVNEAQRKARALTDERMKSVTGGVQIPGLTG